MSYDLHGVWDKQTGINAPFISGDSLNVVRVYFLSIFSIAAKRSAYVYNYIRQLDILLIARIVS